MRELKNTILINGQDCELFYKTSKAQKAKRFSLYSIAMLNIVEALLQGHESDFKFENGITTLNYITTWDEKELAAKRLSNRIIRLRAELPQSAILTYKPLNDYEWRYAVIKDKRNIEALLRLKKDILQRLTNDRENR